MNNHTHNYLSEVSTNQAVKSPNPLILAMALTALLYFTVGSTLPTKKTALRQQTSAIVTPPQKQAIVENSSVQVKVPYSVANGRK
ncbi:hypothetical protein NG798_06995 [Ancylothrix sp. C2]|uniref:hypothetical protein n=1 Tax=Ancylothrix sp. D3o TaxID=2953691 RepID=UPI0021BACC7F|nr:hypothetical protein [Ancylothrix sp. D3o]MCT7949527.1 hypothetical protein [Ancylothrix sp. D3o]